MRLDIDLTQGKIIRNVYFTSDFHLFHNNILKLDNRPFDNLDEMHKVIEESWNEVVKSQDIVIYLGDLSFAKKRDEQVVEELLYSLNGTIHYVMGNHDDYRVIPKNKRFESIQDYLELRLTHMVDGKRVETLFCCMHYPIYSWNKAHHGSYLIHGHCHMNLFDDDKKWFSDMESFSKFIPKEKLEEYHTIIKNKHYYDKRVFDVGCMGWNYKPVSYLEILKLGENRPYGIHH